MKEAYVKLLKRVTDTRNSRLEAYRRNNKLQSLSTYCISGISALTIASSLYLAVAPNDDLKDFVGLIGAIASLFILIISLIDGSKEFSLRAYLYHKCALELSPLCIKLDKHIQKEDFNETIFDEIVSKYDIILNNYSLNHKQEDYDLYTWKYTENFHKENSPLRANFMRFYIDLKTYIMYYIIIIIMILSTVLLIKRMYGNIDLVRNNSSSNTGLRQ